MVWGFGVWGVNRRLGVQGSVPRFQILSLNRSDAWDLEQQTASCQPRLLMDVVDGRHRAFEVMAVRDMAELLALKTLQFRVAYYF